MGYSFVIFAIITGIITLFITAPMWNKKPRTSYLLMMLIPAASMGLFLTLFPSTNTSSHNLSSPVIQTDNNTEVSSLQESLKQNPDDANTILDLAGAYIADEKYGKAISLLKSKQSQFPGNDYIPTQIANAYFAQGLLHAENAEFDTALSSLRYAKIYAPSDADFLPDLEHFIGLIKKDKKRADSNAKQP